MTQAKSHYATTQSSNRVYRVFYGDELLLQSDQAIELSEHYDGRDFDSVIYFPLTLTDGLDLVPSERSTHCPIKGDASYWNFRDVDDAIWCYRDPLPNVESIRDYCAFDQRKGFRVAAGN